MEMHQVRYFLAVTEELNFSRAAEKCNVSQPALSRAILQLEGELGGPLFHRERHLTRLTELNEMVRPHLETLCEAAVKPKLICPDNWNKDLHYLDRPNARRVQLDFFYDYRTNVGLYPKWQAFLREKKPNTIFFWGQDDIFFTREGGESYLEDLPNAEMHRLSSGHFAVEDNLDYIAKNMKRFYQQSVVR